MLKQLWLQGPVFAMGQTTSAVWSPDPNFRIELYFNHSSLINQGWRVQYHKGALSRVSEGWRTSAQTVVPFSEFPQNFVSTPVIGLMFWDFFFKIDFKNIYLWLCWVFAAACRLSLVADSEGLLTSCVATVSHCGGFSCCRTWALGHTGFSNCSFLALEHRLSTCGMYLVLVAWSLVAPWYVGSSWTRDQTCVSCIGRWILYHWAIKEALKIMSLFFFSSTHFFFPCCSPRTHFV